MITNKIHAIRDAIRNAAKLVLIAIGGALFIFGLPALVVVLDGLFNGGT